MSPQPGQPLPQATGRRRSGWEGRPGKGGRKEENGVLAPLWEPEAVNLTGGCAQNAFEWGSELLSGCADPIFPTTGEAVCSMGPASGAC